VEDVFRLLADLLAPPACVACAAPVPAARALCRECRAGFAWLIDGDLKLGFVDVDPRRGLRAGIRGAGTLGHRERPMVYCNLPGTRAFDVELPGSDEVR
jgi:hypothetical protein